MNIVGCITLKNFLSDNLQSYSNQLRARKPRNKTSTTGKILFKTESTNSSCKNTGSGED